jgi:hypothetical protein
VRVYTFSEARQNFASVLERARREGEVKIKRRDGQVFLLQPETLSRSPLDVPVVKADFSTEEIVNIVRKMRARARGLPKSKSSARIRKRSGLKDR